jgi:hypothetical protein
MAVASVGNHERACSLIGLYLITETLLRSCMLLLLHAVS